jgi:hypothetical protein
MRRAAVLLAVVSLPACKFEPGSLGGGLGPDAAPGPAPDARPPGDGPDSHPDAAAAVPPDAAVVDATGPPVICDFASLVESQTLTPELLVTLNSTQVDRDPFITADGTTLYLMSPRPGSRGEDIWRATRADRDAPFLVPVNATELNSAASETRVSLTANQLTLVVSTSRGGEGFDLYVTERQSASQPFPAPVLLGVHTDIDDFDPVISLDGRRLYLSAEGFPGSTGGQDILIRERADAGGTFSPPRLLPAVNTQASEADPAFTADERLIVFARGGDIYYATRASRNEDFSGPQPLTEINTDSREADPFVTADGCELFFASDRAGGLGNLDLYRVRLGP